MQRLKVGVIGAGMISQVYLKNCTSVFQDILEVTSIADLVPDLARKRAAEFNIPNVVTVDELILDPNIQMVLNLTAPAAHAPINLRVLEAGKHVYTEKPFALSMDDANAVVSLAERKGLLVGCAPDTFLGASVQTCLKIVQDGWIGQPYAASGTIIMGSAADGMHPNFQNFLKLGGDPLLDMGPYYLTALVAMLGPARRVTGSAQQLYNEVTVQNPQSHAYGKTVPVEAPTNIAAIIDFEQGAVASFHAAKESFGYAPRLEVFGTEGNLTIPDANFFNGTITIKFRSGESREFPLAYPYKEDSRGIGLADMAYSLVHQRPHRASGQLARHILEIELGIFEAAKKEQHVHLKTRVDKPALLPLGLRYNKLDLV